MKTAILSLLTLLALINLSLGAQLKFEKDTIRVTASLNKKTTQADFKFINQSKKILTIKSADAGCTCMAVQIANNKLSYKPGESGILRAIFELDASQGIVKKDIQLWFNDDPPEKPSQAVTLEIDIPIAIELIPKTLIWTTDGSTESKIIRVRINNPKPINIKAITCTSKAFQTELNVINPGKDYKIKVTPLDNTKPGMGLISVKTDFAIERHRNKQAYAVMKAVK